MLKRGKCQQLNCENAPRRRGDSKKKYFRIMEDCWSDPRIFHYYRPWLMISCIYKSQLTNSSSTVSSQFIGSLVRRHSIAKQCLKFLAKLEPKASPIASNLVWLLCLFIACSWLRWSLGERDWETAEGSQGAGIEQVHDDGRESFDFQRALTKCSFPTDDDLIFES